MRTPQAGLDEQTKQKLDRIADRAARITALIAGIGLPALGVFGCAFVLRPWSWPVATVSGLWTGRLRTVIPFSVASIFLGLRILRDAIWRRKP
jgi:hypothetical protein